MTVEEVSDVRPLLKSTEPIAIFFYMDGCPHCEAMVQPWDELAKEQPIKLYKVESANVPEELGITGFPHFIKIEKGKQKKSVGGEMSKEDLKRKLFTSGGRRLRSRRLRGGRRKTHRTLRRHKSFA